MALGTQFANKILPETISVSGEKHVKGIFTADRNNALACRFYFYFSLVGLRYERCLQVLNKEFYLSETRVARVIMEQRDNLETLRKQAADRKALAKMHPHYNWN